MYTVKRYNYRLYGNDGYASYSVFDGGDGFDVVGSILSEAFSLCKDAIDAGHNVSIEDADPNNKAIVNVIVYDDEGYTK